MLNIEKSPINWGYYYATVLVTQPGVYTIAIQAEAKSVIPHGNTHPCNLTLSS
jgi:hypothetical protein